jgi:hypothetical protein
MIDEAQLLFVRMRDALEELMKRPAVAAMRANYVDGVLDGNIDDDNAITVALECLKDAAPFIDSEGRFRNIPATPPPNPKRLLCCSCGEVLKPYWNLYSVWTCQTSQCTYRGVLTTHGLEPLK